ncbi:MAG: PAS domain-containing sensor histidine kinase [Nitrosotalea sp.]
MDSQNQDESRFRLFFEVSPNLVCTLDNNGIITDINRRALDYIGYTKEELVGKSCFDFIEQDYKKVALDGFAQMQKTGAGPLIEILLIKKDKTKFYGMCSGARLGKIEPPEYIVAIQDISKLHDTLKKAEEGEVRLKDQYAELKKTHESLVLTEKKYRNLYDSSPDMLRTITSDEKIIDCNDAYAKNLGYTKEEIIGKTRAVDHTAEKSFDELTKSIAEWKKSGKIVNREIWMKRKGGSEFPTLLSGTNIYDEKGRLTGRTVALRDITEIYYSRKKIEEDQEKLSQQYTELKNAELAKDEFLAMVTHELKTPLVPIQGYVDLTLAERFGPLTPMQHERLEIVKTSTDSMQKLISDLLDAQKIEIGQLKLEKNTHNLAEIISNAISGIKPLTDKNKIEITTSLRQDTACTCDNTRISQVVTNLVLNAMNFCPKEKGSITITLDKKEKFCSIVVKDNGTGIQKDKLDKIFVRFYQVDTSSTREHKGSGLGLSICKGIVEGHGGKIWAESEGIGKGTAIHILLPV